MPILDSSIPATILYSNRLVLRSVSPETYHALFTGKEEAFICKYLALPNEDAFLIEKQRFLKGLNGYNKSIFYFQLIEPERERIMGWCGFHTWVLHHQRAELGYQLFDPNDWGKGYLKEALRLVLDYGFNELGLHRIEALVEPKNIASLKLVQGAGFTEEGLLHSHYLKNGIFEDSIIFGLISKTT